VRQVLEDLDAAPVDDGLRATLRALRDLTLDPQHFGPEQLAEARAAGVSDAALADAICVCALFNIATRCADALAFDVTTVNPNALATFGYAPPAR
jgi:alkylhydroperoxidase family enzyme